jgi:two-component system, sensor histidine kinase
MSRKESANLPDENTCYIKFKLSIQDFGCGISKEQLNELFINFNNLEEHRKTNSSGRGLGLSICKMIVEQMGGEVHVTSVVNEGSIFSITFRMMCKIGDASKLLQNPSMNLQQSRN